MAGFEGKNSLQRHPLKLGHPFLRRKPKGRWSQKGLKDKKPCFGALHLTGSYVV